MGKSPFYPTIRIRKLQDMSSINIIKGGIPDENVKRTEVGRIV
jgi:hypothetical protein